MTVTEKFLNALKEDEKLREYASKNVPAQGTDKENALVAEPAYQEYLSRHPELKNRTSKNEESEDKKEERSILC